MYVSPIVHAHQLHSCITCKVIQSKDKLKTAKYHPVCKWPIVIISKFEQQSVSIYQVSCENITHCKYVFVHTYIASNFTH